MKLLQRYTHSTCRAAYIGLCLAAAGAAYAQVSSINSVIMLPRVFNDIPGATGTYVDSFPGFISISEAGVSQTTGFADRDVWYFSNDGGASAYQFQNNDYFSASFSVNLTDTADSPRKEAGFLLNNVSGNFRGGRFAVHRRF